MCVDVSQKSFTAVSGKFKFWRIQFEVTRDEPSVAV
jgi:hypothetical protein